MLNFIDAIDEHDRIETVVAGEIDDCLRIIGGSKKFNLLHFNIRSLKKNYDELLVYLDIFGLKSVDVLVLSETFNLGEEVSSFPLAGYNIFYNESKLNKNDGLVIYVRDSINVDSSVVNLGEINMLRCILKLDNVQIGISATYRPPASQIGLFLDELETYLINLQSRDVECGTFCWRY